MQIILSSLIFCIVLFLYLHIYFHYKTSNDLEVYKIEEPSKEKLEEICDLKQPILFEYPNEEILSKFQRTKVDKKYGAFDIKIRNLEKEHAEDEEMYIPTSLTEGINALNNSKSVIENNSDFLEETRLINNFRQNDLFLRPNMVSNCLYDIIYSSNGSRTPLKYELNNRNYLMVIEGTVKIKLAPPKNSKYLNKILDYENFEFRSPFNVWDENDKNNKDLNKVKFLEVELNPKQIIFIPAYWWYSIEFGTDASICSFKYRTFTSSLAILPDLIMKILQNQNIKRKITNSIKFESGD